jgi:hypothetical protein
MPWNEFEKWSGCFVFLSTTPGKDDNSFNPGEIKDLPSNTCSSG